MFGFISDWILRTFPVLVNIDCENSNNIEALILSPIHGCAFIKMKSGAVVTAGVRRRDMLRLNDYKNPGLWVNDYVMN